MNEQAHHTNIPRFEQRHRLALALEWAGLKPEDMAEAIGKSPTTIRNYLSGRTTIGRGDLIAWAVRCGVDHQWLLTGTIDLTEGGPDKDPRSLAGDRRRGRRTQGESSTKWKQIGTVQTIRTDYQERIPA